MNNPQRWLGIALLILGIGMVIVGVKASDSVADQVHETFTGRFTKSTTWYPLGGAVSGVVGVLMLAAPRRLPQ